MGRLIDAERIGEEVRLRGSLSRRLLVLDAAEQEIEQALGGNAAGHQHERARKDRGGTKVVRRRTREKANSVRNANSTPRNKRTEAGLAPASVRVTLTVDGK